MYNQSAHPGYSVLILYVNKTHCYSTHVSIIPYINLYMYIHTGHTHKGTYTDLLIEDHIDGL